MLLIDFKFNFIVSATRGNRNLYFATQESPDFTKESVSLTY